MYKKGVFEKKRGDVGVQYKNEKWVQVILNSTLHSLVIECEAPNSAHRETRKKRGGGQMSKGGGSPSLSHF